MTPNEVSHRAIDINYGYCVPTFHTELHYPDTMSRITWEWISPDFRYKKNGVECVFQAWIEYNGQTEEELHKEAVEILEVNKSRPR